MSVQILIAGCPPRDRGRIEDLVKRAFSDLPDADPWRVSLVKLGSSWSVSLDGPGPGLKGLSLTASEDLLQETIANAVGKNGLPSAPTSHLSLEELEEAEGLLLGAAPVPDEGPAVAPDCYDCPACGHRFRVVYVSQPREPVRKAPVACPVCWELTDVSVPESAAATQEYRAERI